MSIISAFGEAVTSIYSFAINTYTVDDLPKVTPVDSYFIYFKVPDGSGAVYAQ